MTYPEAIDFLYSLRLFGTKFGLENTLELAQLNGNPHERLEFIHVAGTNGKGSTCAILESIYRTQGLRTGLFTSPHLVSFTERIQVNRKAISKPDVARLVSQLIAKLGGADLESWPFRPTFFEFVTIMALLYFEEQKCDLVIWETGMGGRLDATNIVTPLASIITNIQYDHQPWLGNTLEQIAAEKAGIIKPEVPVVTAVSEPAALAVVRSTALSRKAPLIEVGAVTELPVTVPLRGAHQKMNAAVALATIHALQERIPVSDAAIRQGVESVEWSGRLQLVRLDGCELLLDGAHNPDGAKSLAKVLQTDFKDRPVTLILGLFRDKSWKEMCDILIPIAERIIIAPIQSERSADPGEVRAYCSANWPAKSVTTCEHLKAAIQEGRKNPFLVIAGSLHLVGESMEILGISSSPSERALNEWDAANSAAVQKAAR